MYEQADAHNIRQVSVCESRCDSEDTGYPERRDVVESEESVP